MQTVHTVAYRCPHLQPELSCGDTCSATVLSERPSLRYFRKSFVGVAYKASVVNEARGVPAVGRNAYSIVDIRL